MVEKLINKGVKIIHVDWYIVINAIEYAKSKKMIL